eukprot:scaffold33544_cov144-Skeletonema_dohrnii-CCMP3373.AAC.1
MSSNIQHRLSMFILAASGFPVKLSLVNNSFEYNCLSDGEKQCQDRIKSPPTQRFQLRDIGRTICTATSPQSSQQLKICCMHHLEIHADSSHPRIDIDAIMTHTYYEYIAVAAMFRLSLPLLGLAHPNLSDPSIPHSTTQKFAIVGHTFDIVLLHRYH